MDKISLTTKEKKLTAKRNGLSLRTLCLAIVAIIVCLNACSLDHGESEMNSDEEVDNVISGTVSAGGPVKGYILLKNAGASTSALRKEIDGNGNFTIKLPSNMTGPYILQARGTVGGRSVCLHSIGTRADLASTVNITPFTHLVVGNLTGQDPAAYFDAFEPALPKIATQENIVKHEALVRSRFAGVFQMLGVNAEDVNLLNTPFNPDHAGMDAALDFIRFTPVWDVNGVKQPQVRVKLLLTDDEIIEDFTKEDDTAALPATEILLSAQREFFAIAQVFESWQNLFSASSPESEGVLETKGLPGADDPELTALFSAESFLQNGSGLSPFLVRLCKGEEAGAASLENMTFSGLALESLDLEKGKAVVSFTVYHSSGHSEDQLFWELEKTGGSWHIMGNQQRIDCFIGSYAAYSQTEHKIIANGLCVYAWTPFVDEAADIHHITVSGPGLPDGFELTRVGDDNRVLFLPSGSSPQGFYEPVDPSAVKENSRYEFRLYDMEGNLLTENSCKRYLKMGNGESAALFNDRTSIFCDIKTPFQTTLNMFAGEGKKLDVAWGTSASMVLKEINYDYAHSAGDSNIRHLLLQNAINDSVTIPDQAITRFDIYIRNSDIYGRMFDVFLSDSQYLEGTKAKNIIHYGMENGVDSIYPYRLF
jgi:hypothetical protein